MPSWLDNAIVLLALLGAAWFVWRTLIRKKPGSCGNCASAPRPKSPLVQLHRRRR